MLLAMSVGNQQVHAADAANAILVMGAGTVNTAGNVTTINQASQKMALDWTSLSTRANEALIFNQPNAAAIALNRITGTSPSELLGSLTANGQVFILNPNGVLFGAGSQVNVGGLVASTMNLSNADFDAGNFKFSGSGSGAVVNQGTLTAASGGYLALLAPEVRNEGVMVASLGTALLAAGNKVTLNLDNGSLLGYSIDQGAINALAENKQLIKADGGQVLLSARAMDALTTATVNNTGIIEAKTIQNKAGRILLMGDMEYGTVNIGGTLDASAPNGGDGGFIETSAASFRMLPGLQVNTRAAQGKTGIWLLDPTAVTIAAGTGAAANTFYEDTLEAAGANVVIQATDSINVTGTFSNGDLEIASGLNLTIQTTGSSGTGIDLTGSTDGAALNFKVSGGGSVLMSTGSASQTLKTSKVTVTGGGSITLNSAGMLDISNTTLQTAGGAISLTGAGTSLGDGVKISKGIVDAGTGALTITGSSTTGGHGVNIEDNSGASQLTGGTVNITGATSGDNYGIRVDRSTITASNGLTLDSATGDSRMLLRAATLTASGGNMLIKSKGASTTTGAGFFQSLLIEDVSGTRSNIRNTGSGNLTIDAQLTSHASSTGTPSALLVRNSDITAGAGTISLTGATGTSGYVEGTTGVLLANGAKVSGVGNIAVTGTAGSTAHVNSYGVNLLTGSEVSSTGGNVAITGTFNNPASHTGTGARVAGKVQSGPGGSITLTGNATVGNSSGTGVHIDSGANLIAGTGGLTIVSSVSSSTTVTNPISAQMSGGSISSTGAIDISGLISASSAPNARGVILEGGTINSNGSAITLRGSGVPPPAPPSSREIHVGGTTLNSGGGQIELIGDRVEIQSSINAGVGRVVIRPTNTNREITLGGSSETNALNLSSSELNMITAGTLVIGSASNTGGITIGNSGGSVAPANVSTLSLLNSSGNTFNPGISQTAGITIANLNADGRSVNLTNASNQIGQVSGRSYAGNFAVRSASALSVGTVDGTVGINSGSNTTQLISDGALSQTQAIVASTLQATSNGGMTLGNAGNQIGSFGNLGNTTSGNLVLRNTAANASFNGTVSSAGRVDIGNTGSVTLGANSLSGASTATGTAAGSAAISVVATGGISASGAAPHITNSAGGTVYLEAGNGSIGASAGSALGVSSTGPVTAVATGTGAQVNLSMASGGTLENISATGAVNVAATTGSLAVKTVSGTGVTLSAAAGAITDGNGASNNITATTLNASAQNGITLGTNVSGLHTLTTTAAAGDISITAANALSTSNVSVSTNAGAAQTVSLSSGAGITVDTVFGNAQDNFKLTATGGNLNVNAALTANKLTLSTAGTSAQTAAITATGLELLGSGSHTLNHAGNAVTTIAGNTGGVSYSQAGALIIGTVNTAGLASTGKVLVQTTGAASDLTVANAVSAASTASDALVLASGRNFINSSGSATPLSTGSGGRYLVYSTDPSANSLATMVSPGNAFNRTFTGNAPTDASMTSITGNRLVYSIQPTLNIAADNQTKAFGGADPALSYMVNSGLVAGDTAASALSGALSAPTGAATTGPTHAITQGTLASGIGYAINYTGGTLTITGAPAAPAPAAAPVTPAAAAPATQNTVETIALGGTTLVPAYKAAIENISGITIAAAPSPGPTAVGGGTSNSGSGGWSGSAGGSSGTGSSGGSRGGVSAALDPGGAALNEAFAALGGE